MLYGNGSGNPLSLGANSSFLSEAMAEQPAAIGLLIIEIKKEDRKMENNIQTPGPSHDLLFRKPIQKWDEALPIGNGLTGCLIWGDGAPLRFSLDRADLWDKRPAEETLADNYN